MQISKIFRWLLSFFSNVIKKTTADSSEIFEDKVYKNLMEKVEQLEYLMQEETKKNERLKTCFLNNIYHEIRTPMNAIVGFSELLQSSGLSEERKNLYLNKIRQSSEEFLGLLDHLIEASVLESGNLVLNKSDCDLSQMIDELGSFYNIQKHVLEKGNVAMVKNTDKDYPDLIIISDRCRLNQILSNLVNNAIKFTSRGVIEFGYKVVNPSQILFFVKDSGNGIVNNHEKDLFENFIKSDYCDNKENRGLGLGLSISKGIINLMGGTIWVENNNNLGGATFKFTIPLERANAQVTNKTKGESKLSNMLY